MERKAGETTDKWTVFALVAIGVFMSTLDSSEFARYRDALRSPLERLAGCGRPSIAAIEGRALGGNFQAGGGFDPSWTAVFGLRSQR